MYNVAYEICGFYIKIKTIFIGIGISIIQCSPFTPKSLYKKPHSSPVRTRHGVYFVGPTSDLYSASIPAVMYAILCYTGLCYNSTELYTSNQYYGDFYTGNMVSLHQYDLLVCAKMMKMIASIIWLCIIVGIASVIVDSCNMFIHTLQGCFNSSAIQKDMGEINWYLTTHKNAVKHEECT